METTNRRLLLEISNLVGGLWVSVNAFDRDGWEERSRGTGWKDDRHSRRYEDRGGKASLAEAIQEAAGIGAEEAVRIAEDAIDGWPSHLSDTEISGSLGGLRDFLVVLALLVVAFIALLIVLAVALT
ncbi:MAG TPA: hypothetical protein VNJ04_00890 [Gemmatimonadaceae bacterium]|nr:hypothetical protein [Gemmatimonadaceae bacterium]